MHDIDYNKIKDFPKRHIDIIRRHANILNDPETKPVVSQETPVVSEPPIVETPIISESIPKQPVSTPIETSKPTLLDHTWLDHNPPDEIRRQLRDRMKISTNKLKNYGIDVGKDDPPEHSGRQYHLHPFKIFHNKETGEHEIYWDDFPNPSLSIIHLPNPKGKDKSKYTTYQVTNHPNKRQRVDDETADRIKRTANGLHLYEGGLVSTDYNTLRSFFGFRKPNLDLLTAPPKVPIIKTDSFYKELSSKKDPVEVITKHVIEDYVDKSKAYRSKDKIIELVDHIYKTLFPNGKQTPDQEITKNKLVDDILETYKDNARLAEHLAPRFITANLNKDKEAEVSTFDVDPEKGEDRRIAFKRYLRTDKDLLALKRALISMASDQSSIPEPADIDDVANEISTDKLKEVVAKMEGVRPHPKDTELNFSSTTQDSEPRGFVKGFTPINKSAKVEKQRQLYKNLSTHIRGKSLWDHMIHAAQEKSLDNYDELNKELQEVKGLAHRYLSDGDGLEKLRDKFIEFVGHYADKSGLPALYLMSAFGLRVGENTAGNEEAFGATNLKHSHFRSIQPKLKLYFRDKGQKEADIPGIDFPKLQEIVHKYKNLSSEYIKLLNAVPELKKLPIVGTTDTGKDPRWLPEYRQNGVLDSILGKKIFDEKGDDSLDLDDYKPSTTKHTPIVYKESLYPIIKDLIEEHTGKKVNSPLDLKRYIPITSHEVRKMFVNVHASKLAEDYAMLRMANKLHNGDPIYHDDNEKYLTETIPAEIANYIGDTTDTLRSSYLLKKVTSNAFDDKVHRLQQMIEDHGKDYVLEYIRRELDK